MTETFEIAGEFFELTLDGKVVKVRSGPVGTKGKIHKTSYPNPDRAQLEYAKLVAQKRAAAAGPPAREPGPAPASPASTPDPPPRTTVSPEAAETPPAEPSPEPVAEPPQNASPLAESAPGDAEPRPAGAPVPAAQLTHQQSASAPPPPSAALPTEDPSLLLALPPEQRTSLAPRPAVDRARNVKKVPFVELFGNRVQGVVSSGSDIARVYVCWVEAGTFNFCCSTNNNRPCGGAYPAMPCGHIQDLLNEAHLQYGDELITRLKVRNYDPEMSQYKVKWFSDAGGALTKEPSGTVFSRFLSYLSYCELAARPGSCRELAWFPQQTVSAEPTHPLPAGLAESTTQIAGLDACLSNGFARLGPDHHASLETLAALYDGTPLTAAQAVEAIARSEFLTPHFLTLAKARAALLGAQHDALHALACAQFNLTPVAADDPPAAPAGPAATLLAGAQQWLMELALAGFEHLEDSSVAPFATLLSQLQGHPELTGPTALLTGFYQELLHGEPHPRRWADLWMAAMVGTEHLLGEAPFQELSGSFIPWGLAVQSHEFFLNASVYGLLNGKQAVRIPFATWKVDLVGELDLLDPTLMQCLEGPFELQVAGELSPHGDLLIKSAHVGAKANPFDHPVPQLPRVPALQRHPVQLTLPYKGAPPVPRSNTDLPESDNVLGLLRFDGGGWQLQPLAVLTRKGPVCSGGQLAKLHAKKKNPTLELLRERASRLLRS